MNLRTLMWPCPECGLLVALPGPDGYRDMDRYRTDCRHAAARHGLERYEDHPVLMARVGRQRLEEMRRMARHIEERTEDGMSGPLCTAGYCDREAVWPPSTSTAGSSTATHLACPRSSSAPITWHSLIWPPCRGAASTAYTTTSTTLWARRRARTPRRAA